MKSLKILLNEKNFCRMVKFLDMNNNLNSYSTIEATEESDNGTKDKTEDKKPNESDLLSLKGNK